jgi:hypothetical protein
MKSVAHCVLASSVQTAVCEVLRFGLGEKVGQDFRRSIGPGLGQSGSTVPRTWGLSLRKTPTARVFAAHNAPCSLPNAAFPHSVRVAGRRLEISRRRSAWRRRRSPYHTLPLTVPSFKSCTVLVLVRDETRQNETKRTVAYDSLLVQFPCAKPRSSLITTAEAGRINPK